MLIGYAYSGGDDRDGLKAQVEALGAAGCERWFVDEGAWRERPLIEPIVGFRHWRVAQGTLSSMFSMTTWETADMTARCTGGNHDPAHTPASQCTCGVYAYYEPCPRTASAMNSDLVGGAVVVWGQVEAHATGVRAEHARIVALDLPLLRTRKRRAVTQIAERLGVRAIPHRQLKAEALTHGAPLPSSLRPPRQRAPVTSSNWLTGDDS